jgi:glucose/mannose-6-phosphate isomerase
MGGSSVGGRLAAGALAPRLRRPIALAMGYDIPAWIGRETLVLCASYSGTTEETLATYDAAKAAGAPRLVATTGGALAERARDDGVPVIPLPGGFQPRAAVGYSLVTALEAAALCGAAPSVRDEIERAAALAAELAAEWGPDGDEAGDAKRIARALHGTIPVFVGAGMTASVAYRWKTQVNENAELPAFASKLPEHDHNEVVGWGGADGRLGAVFLDDPGGDERALRRMEVTAEIAAGGAAVVERVTPRGDSRLERLVSLVLLGDLVSLYLAVLRGVDPMNVQAIDMLKRRLAAYSPSGSR